MGLLSELFGPKKVPEKTLGIALGEPPLEQTIRIDFSYGSTHFQHLYALEDQLERVISHSGAGGYEGKDVAADGSTAAFHLYGPDAEALFRLISPVLAQYPFMRGAKVTLWFGPPKRKTPKRVIELPD